LFPHVRSATRRALAGQDRQRQTLLLRSLRHLRDAERRRGDRDVGGQCGRLGHREPHARDSDRRTDVPIHGRVLRLGVEHETERSRVPRPLRSVEATMRKPIIAAALFALSIAAPAFAAVDNACWNRNLQLMDFFMSPPQSGDSQFFSSVGTKGVVALLFATRNTMNAFPTSLYEFRTGNPSDPTPTGCSNLTMNALRYYMSGNEAPSLQGSFSTALTYPDPEPAYTKVLTVSDGIDPTLFYQYGKWPNGPPGSGATSTPLTALNACNAATANNVVLSSQCQSCVNTRGFWLNPTVANNDTSASAAVFSGKWLRFYPPKWILLKLAYKRLLNGPLLSSIREGVITFNGATGGQVIQKLLPNSCQGQGATTGTGILKQKIGRAHV